LASDLLKSPTQAPDRTITTTAPDGTEKTFTYKAGKLELTTIKSKDGTTNLLPNGDYITDKTDHTVVVYTASTGTTITTKPDGTTITKYKDGRTITH